ncbi:MAG: hypothetical protein FWH38_04605 [Treponema sp.]|nr:hypothetical protein [Treponema sp.]
MRRLIVFSVLFALIAGMGFAQLAEGITLYSWGSGAFIPLRVVSDFKYEGETLSDTGYSVAGVGIPWGGMKPGLNLQIDGTYQYVGFNMAFSLLAFNADGDFVVYKDFAVTHEIGASFWIKPFGNDLIKLTLGKFEDYTLRGKIGVINGGFEYFQYGGLKEDDQIFSRFTTHNSNKNHVSKDSAGYITGANFADVGFMISSAPVKGLYLGVMVDGSMYSNGWGGNISGARAVDVYRYLQAGAGYKIGAADIRAQYIGGFIGTYDQTRLNNVLKKSGDVPITSPYSVMAEKPARFEAAFSFSGVPNLFFDMGMKAWMPVEFTDLAVKYGNGFDFSLGATYRASALNIAARVDAMHLGAFSYDSNTDSGGRSTGSDNKAADSPVVDFRLVPSYSFPAVTVGLDLGLRVTGESKAANGDGNKDSMTELGFGAFVKMGFAGGYAKTGLIYSLAPLNNDGKAHGQSVLQIPIVLEYWFF